MKKIIEKIFLAKSGPKNNPEEEERIKFSQEVKQQLMQLRQKGLSIPVFTL